MTTKNKGNWKSWSDFLGTKKEVPTLSFDEARKIAKKILADTVVKGDQDNGGKS